MSLPLWEECAWYVDVPDEDFEQAEFCESENGNEFYEEEAVGEVDQDDEGPAVEIEQVDEEFTNEVEQVDEAAAFDVERGGQDASCDAEQNADIQIEISDKEYISPADYHDVDLEYIEQPNESPDAEGNMPDANDIENQKPETMDDENIEAEPFANPLEEECCPDVPENEFFDIPIDIIEMEEEEVPTIEYKFPINRSINKRIYLYLGEIYKLPCDAIVIGQVENLMDRNDGNDVIFTLAGIELEPELRQLSPCGTGDSVITKGWQMPCEWIIHSVGPKYDERYLNAADHALFSAYKSALLLAAEKEVQSLVIGTIYKQSKNYPRFDAAHVALRTVRKFLEHSVGDVFDRVMFCVNTQEDFEIYSALMHAYFPRSEEELQDQLNLLPLELGDEWGEIIIKDRVVKVSVGPKPLPRESLQQYKALHDNEHEETASTGPKKLGIREIKSVGTAPRSMTQADSDPDYARRMKVMNEFAQMSREERLRLRFQAMAQNLDEEDLDDLDALRLVHFLGKDFKERTVVYLSGPNLLRAENMDRNRVLLYLIKRMEPLRCVPFVLIYGCATLGESYYPDTNFMQSVFDLFACRYQENLMKFYILHASYSFRMYFWLLLPLETTTFWSSYTNLTNLRSLRHYMDIPSLDIPAELLRYDRENYTYT